MEASNPAEFLNYHHLRYFWTVAREGSLRRAAEKLRISQPSICSQIKLLETALGESLFRRSGRSLVLTEFGELMLRYSEEIFTLGRELLAAARRAPTARALHLNVGIVDSFPKLMSLDILRPAFVHDPPVVLSCQEGKLDDLLARLATHRLDVVLADEPAPSGMKIRAFNHSLGSSGVTFCAAPFLARQMIGKFPRNLDGAPALLPTQNTGQRRELERWFREVKVEPRVVAEFEDASLAKIVATDGLGFIAVPTVVAPEAVERYGFVPIGEAKDCQTQLFVITAERRMEHPVVIALARHAEEVLRRKKSNRTESSRSVKRRAARRKVT